MILIRLIQTGAEEDIRMKNLNKRITWFLFYLIGWIILMINGNRSKKLHFNFLKEFKELCKKHSKYTEDDDYIIVHQEKL